MQSKATTVAQYLKELPADRRAAIEAVRKVILANVDGQIEEGMQYGMIGYYVPHHIFPNGYHCDPSQPLPYMGLASQKQNMAVYMMFAYLDPVNGEQWIRAEYARRGRKIDMGKSCLRFKSLADLDLEVLAAAIKRAPTARYVDMYFTAAGPGAWKSKGTAAAKKVAAKSPPVKKAAVKKGAVKKAATKKAAAKKK
jgi:hypothetical protein